MSDPVVVSMLIFEAWRKTIEPRAIVQMMALESVIDGFAAAVSSSLAGDVRS